jgi:hypothetical protein
MGMEGALCDALLSLQSRPGRVCHVRDLAGLYISNPWCVGRAYVYGLGAHGETGVRRAIDIITRELDVTIALTGVSSVAKIGSEVLMPIGGANVAHQSVFVARS